MALQFSHAVRNAAVDAIAASIGPAPVLELRGGTKPATTSDADVGPLLSSIAMPTVWMAPGVAGTSQMSGTWQDLAADATGTLSYWRIKSGGQCLAQGDIALSGAENLVVDSLSVTSGRVITIASFAFTIGGA